MNKKERNFWERYLWSMQKYGLRGIEDCYDKPSQAKKEAYRRIVTSNPGARYMTVVNAGCQAFCVGWLEQVEGNWYFRYETAYNAYYVKLDKDMMLEAEARGVCRVCLWKK